jgi:hypothetical protein
MKTFIVFALDGTLKVPLKVIKVVDVGVAVAPDSGVMLIKDPEVVALFSVAEY